MEKKTIFRPRYWMVPTIISDDPRTEPFDEKVYAAVDWFHGMKDGECRASNQTLAELIKPHDPQPRSVQNSLNRLEECGYIARYYKDAGRRNRERIVPLIELAVRNRHDTSNETAMIPERNGDDTASETAMTRVRIVSKNRSNKAAQSAAGNAKPKHDAMGAEVVKAMEAVDPKNKRYYGNTTQRAACDFLIAEYGLQEVLKRVKVLPRTNRLPHFPTINTPHELMEKWVKLDDAVARMRAEAEKKKPKPVVV